VASIAGDVVDIGSWEGKSTIALANACFPDPVLAVDTWRGNTDEGTHHVSVILAQQRDVYQTFQDNVSRLTRGNVIPMRMHSAEFLASHSRPIKFCHIDASHHYRSVRRDIEGALRLLVDEGILCGDDFNHANRRRADLEGGVERAVRELLPGFRRRGNFWWWLRRGPRTDLLSRIIERFRSQ